MNDVHIRIFARGRRTDPLPKVIENLREKLLQSAKAELLEKGFDALTLRGVAWRCGIAVGTTYNYFPSKDMLVGTVILDDWMKELTRMRADCERAGSVREALCALYEGVMRFSAIYQNVWAGYTFTAGAKSDFARRHTLLVMQIADCLRPALTRAGAGEDAELALFFAENILICADNSALQFDSFLRITERILP